MPAAARPHDARDRYQLTSGGLSDDAGCCILASTATAGCGNLAASAAAGLARQRSVLLRLIASVAPRRSDELAEHRTRAFHSLCRIWSHSPDAPNRQHRPAPEGATLRLGHGHRPTS